MPLPLHKLTGRMGPEKPKAAMRPGALTDEFRRIDEKYAQPGAFQVDIAAARQKYDHRPGSNAMLEQRPELQGRILPTAREQDSDGYMVARRQLSDPPDMTPDIEAHFAQLRSKDEGDAAVQKTIDDHFRPQGGGTTLGAGLRRGVLPKPVPTAPPQEDMVPLQGEPGLAMYRQGLVGTHVPVNVGGRWYARRAARSDERSKQAIQMVRRAPAYEYEYKPGEQGPGAPPGKHVGPMAQDLEKTPAGRSVVFEDQSGTKNVDTARLPLILTAAMHDVDQRLRKLEGK